MGRALIYVCAITVTVLGIIQINLNDRYKTLAKRTSEYADQVEVRNMAHSGAELALNRIKTSPFWRNNYQPYAVHLDYGTANVIIQDNSTNPSLGANQLRLVSRAMLSNDSARVVYRVKLILAQLPSIPGALALTNSNFTTDFGGSFYISGLDEAGSDSVGLPGISVIDQTAKDQILNTNSPQFLDQIDGNSGAGSDPSIKIDNSMNFNELSQFIDRLLPNATVVQPDQKTDLGSSRDPGVFVVNEPVHINAKVNGYGILVVKQTGDLDINIFLNGKFNFYGLVLFENTWAFNGNGTVSIHGSVVVGSQDVSSIDINLLGNISILYNSTALEYEREAAQKEIAANFQIEDVYE